MQLVVQPGPVLINRVQVEGGAILGRRVSRSNASNSPAQVHARPLEFKTVFFKLPKKGTWVLNCVSNSDLQVSDSCRSGKVADDVYSVAILQPNEGGRQYLIGGIREGQYGSKHPVHMQMHVMKCHFCFPVAREAGFENRQLAVGELYSCLSDSGDHEMEARLVVQGCELLHPALDRLDWVLIIVAPLGLN